MKPDPRPFPDPVTGRYPDGGHMYAGRLTPYERRFWRWHNVRLALLLAVVAWLLALNPAWMAPIAVIGTLFSKLR